MNTLIFFKIIIIINLILIPSAVPLTTGDTIALKDMYKQWCNFLDWKLPIESACGNWKGITCATDNVVSMFVN